MTLAPPPAAFPSLVLHPRDQMLEPAQQERVLYRRLNDGDPVERDDVICWLDDQMVTARMESALKTRAAALEVQRSARGGVDLTREKLNLSIALLHQPNLLLLDEPYSGFDWETYVKFWQLSESLRNEGTTILVVSHFIEERSHFDRIVHLKDGLVVGDEA